MFANIIKDHEFGQFRRFLYDTAGISLADSKKALVSGRLAKRLQHHGLSSYGEYYRILASGDNPSELQLALDLLTTNETYFFREPKHFDFLRGKILTQRMLGRVFRVWSAACSSGEEPYSLSMVLADELGGDNWEVVASDISTRVLNQARNGHYPMERSKDIPRPYLQEYCLKGVGSQDGTFIIAPYLRKRVQFRQVNLNNALPSLGEFDLILLRNVMIYFDLETKQKVVGRILPLLRKGGYFIIGHSETLNGVTGELKPIAPSIYMKT